MGANCYNPIMQEDFSEFKVNLDHTGLNLTVRWLEMPECCQFLIITHKSLSGKRKKKINALFIISYILFLATKKLFLGQNTKQSKKLRKLCYVCKPVCSFLSLTYEKENEQWCRGVGSSLRERPGCGYCEFGLHFSYQPSTGSRTGPCVGCSPREVPSKHLFPQREDRISPFYASSANFLYVFKVSNQKS